MSSCCGAENAQPGPQDGPPLHNSIIAMVSLASGIAANHPATGQCQLERLRQAGVAESQIATLIDIARHIRDEAAEKLDHAFDVASGNIAAPASEPTSAPDDESCGCTPTPSGQSCC